MKEKAKDKVKKPIYKRVWFIVLCVFILLSIIGSIGDESEQANGEVTNQEVIETNSETNTSETQSTDGSNTNDVQSDTYIEATVDDLVDVLNDNPLRASNTYNDKRIKLTGRLMNIDASGKYFSLAPMNDEWSFTTVNCYIDKNHIEQVSEFSKGQTVTLLGEVTGVGEVLGYSIEVESIVE